MLRKGEPCSPTEICHVYDINVRCYVKAAGAQCAPLCSQQNFKYTKNFGRDSGQRPSAYAWNGCTARQACQIWQAFFVLFAD